MHNIIYETEINSKFCKKRALVNCQAEHSSLPGPQLYAIKVNREGNPDLQLHCYSEVLNQSSLSDATTCLTMCKYGETYLHMLEEAGLFLQPLRLYPL